MFYRIVLLIFLVMLPACEKFKQQAIIQPSSIVAYGDPSTGKADEIKPLNLNAFKFPSVNEYAYQEALESKPDRNMLISELMSRSDSACARDLASMVSNEATVTSSTSLAAMVTATASTIAAAPLAKSILSGFAAVSLGARDIYRSEVFRNVVSSSLVTAIKAERARLKAKIDLKMKEVPYTFNIMEGIQLVNEYHLACSWYNGLSLVVAAVEKEKNNVAKETQKNIDDNNPLKIMNNNLADIDVRVKAYEEKLKFAKENKDDAGKTLYAGILNDLEIRGAEIFIDKSRLNSKGQDLLKKEQDQNITLNATIASHKATADAAVATLKKVAAKELDALNKEASEAAEKAMSGVKKDKPTQE